MNSGLPPVRGRRPRRLFCVCVNLILPEIKVPLSGAFEVSETALMNLGDSGKRANVLRVSLQVLVMKGRRVTEGLNFPQL
jgi:hypothetical protein